MRITAVVFDWAGTMVDHGSCAPVATLQAVFEDAGVAITAEEARRSMGIAKRDHIAAILDIPRVRSEWKQRHGENPGLADLEALYARFIPKQTACLGEHSRVIDGVSGAVEALRARGVRIGSTTGYTRPMLELLIGAAKEQGFGPDCAVCPEDVPGGGRPGPWMCYLNAIRLAAAPMWTMIKIGDTPSDIEEGRNAGMWTVGVTRTGNEVGLSEGEWNVTAAADRAILLAKAESRLYEAGAHYIVESAGGCLAIADDVEKRLAAGDRP